MAWRSPMPHAARPHTAAIGALFIDVIKSLLFSPAVVVVTMITGGLIILAVEGRAMVPTVHNTLHIRCSS